MELPFGCGVKSSCGEGKSEEQQSPPLLPSLSPLGGWVEVRGFQGKALGLPTRSPGSLPPALGRCLPLVNSTPPELPGISNNTSISQGIRWASSCSPISVLHPSPTTTPLILSVPNSGLLDSLNARDISVKIFEDFAQSWYWILV